MIGIKRVFYVYYNKVLVKSDFKFKNIEKVSYNNRFLLMLIDFLHYFIVKNFSIKYINTSDDIF